MHDHAGQLRIATNQRRLTLALSLAGAYMVAEAVGAWWTGSLALLADAGHMLSDVFALTLSLVAIRIAQQPPTPSRTYGYFRTEILAALAHGVLLVGVSLYILLEAWARLGEPRQILGGPMLLVASGGLAINLAGLAILGAGRRDNLNMRGAWLHVLSDALGSVGAMAAGAAVWWFGWAWADPVASVLIAVLIVHSSWILLREVVSVLMEAAPEHIDVQEVERSISGVAGVLRVHDLHVWSISSGLVSLSGHVVAEEERPSGELLREISDLLEQRFEIRHTTIQLEPEGFEEFEEVCSG